MPYNLTLEERETILRFSESPDDSVTFETFNKRHALRLIRDGAIVKRTATRGNVTYWTLSFPKNWFRWPRRPSEARRLASLARVQSGFKPGTRREQSEIPVESNDAA